MVVLIDLQYSSGRRCQTASLLGKALRMLVDNWTEGKMFIQYSPAWMDDTVHASSAYWTDCDPQLQEVVQVNILGVPYTSCVLRPAGTPFE